MHQILVVEDDPYFSGVLVDVLKADGFSVILRDRADSALVAARRRAPSLLLISQELPDRTGLELIKELRKSEKSPGVPIILMSDGDSSKLRGSLKLLGVSALLTKPFSVMELPARVRQLLGTEDDDDSASVDLPSEVTPYFSVPAELEELEDADTEESAPLTPLPRILPEETEETEELPAAADRQPPAGRVRRGGGSAPAGQPAAEVGSPLHFEPPPGALPCLDSLQTVARVWANESDGVLRIMGSADWVTFSRGEPMDAREARLAEGALYRPGVTFQALSHAPGEPGASIAPGLLEAGRRAADVRSIASSLDRCLLADRATKAALRLPVTPALAGLLYDADSRSTLRELCAASHLDVEEIARDLAALLAMGLIKLGAFRHPAARSGPAAPAAPPSPAPPRPYREPPRPTGSRVHSPADLGSVISTAHSLDRPSTTSESPSRESLVSHSETLYERPGLSDPSVTTRSMVSTASARDRAVSGQLKEQLELKATLQRLRKEVERLEGASDWTVLSLPAGAPPEMVEQAGQRMLARYSAEVARQGMPEEGRLAAARLLTLVGEALERIREGRPREAEDPNAGKTDAEIIFEQGVLAAEKERWDRAVQCFTAARNQQLDAPEVMAWLGWSIYKQAKKPGYRDEALELLQLADSFDPGMPQGQYFLAVLEAETGRDGDAFERLQRLLMNDPDHAEARALFKKMDAQRQADRAR